MPEMVSLGPFQELDLRHNLGTHPNALLHSVSIQPFTPAGAPLLREIAEGTFADLENRETLKQRAPQALRQSATHPCGVDQIVAAVKADNQRIQSARSRHETADHELLSLIDAQLHPCARTLTGLVQTVFALRHDPFEIQCANSNQHVGRASLREVDDPNSR